jgi:hypothetical protein
MAPETPKRRVYAGYDSHLDRFGSQRTEQRFQRFIRWSSLTILSMSACAGLAMAMMGALVPALLFWASGVMASTATRRLATTGFAADRHGQPLTAEDADRWARWRFLRHQQRDRS